MPNLLLNSILVETETVNDEYFQSLLNLIVNGGDEDKNNTINLPTGYSENLIFCNIDKIKNLSIPYNKDFFSYTKGNLNLIREVN